MKKEISGYRGRYFITEEGKVFSSCRGKLKEMSPSLSKAGYLKINLQINGIRTTYLMHRLVATHFINNTQNKPCVNHKNGIKSDNRVENLEWVTTAENNYHALKTGLKVMPKWTDGQRSKFMHKVKENGGSNCKKVIDINTGAKYDSVKSAAKILGINYQTLFAMVSGRNTNKTNIRYA